MEGSKRRKTGDSSVFAVSGDASVPPPALSVNDGRKVLQLLSEEQLVDILQAAISRDGEILNAVLSVADSDLALRKLFIRSLGLETTTNKLIVVFSPFGEIVDAVVVTDKSSGKSKGYGFVTFKHIDGAILALKEPSKKIDGRITVSQLAAVRERRSTDVWARKVFLGNVPFEISSERLLNYFSAYGEIEEGPLGFDKEEGRSKGFAFFIYKTEDGAKMSLVNPVKIIDGYQIVCKMAARGGNSRAQGPTEMPRDYGGQASYSRFAGGPPQHNPPLLIGGGGYTAFGGYPAVGHYGGSAAPGVYPELYNHGSSMNSLPPNFGGYPGFGPYGYASAFQAPPPPAGPRGPPGWSFQGGLPFY